MQAIQLSNQASVTKRYSLKNLGQSLFDFITIKPLRDVFKMDFTLEFTEEDVKTIEAQLWR